MSVHAFIDESGNRGTYQLAVAMVDSARVDAGRRFLRSLLLPGERELHCKHDKPKRRRELADRIVGAGYRVTIYRTPSTDGDEQARARCLRAAVVDLLKLDTHRLVLDSREGRDHHDERLLREALGPRPSATGLTYQHLDSKQEPLLWIADVLGWCYNRGGDWRRRVAAAVDGYDLHL